MSRMTGRIKKPGPYTYYDTLWRTVLVIFSLTIVFGVITGVFHSGKDVNPATDPKYHKYRMMFNAQTGKPVFKD